MRDPIFFGWHTWKGTVAHRIDPDLFRQCFLLAKFVKDHSSADAKAQHGDQRDHLCYGGRKVKTFTGKSDKGKDNTQYVQPKGNLNIARHFAVTKAQLEHQGDSSDGGNDNNRN